VISQEINSLHSNFRHSLEYISALIVVFFCAMFSFWTIASNSATVFNIPWKSLSEIVRWLLPLFILFSLMIARRFSISYCGSLVSQNISAQLPSLKSLIVFLISACLIITSGSYSNKFFVLVIAAVALFFISRKKISLHENKVTHNISMQWRNLIALLLIILIAVLIVLLAHRPDLDDSSFIQIATQTLANSDRAPLSFDASLGYIIDLFRFYPYRVSSYETFIAFVSDFLNINVYTTYYLLIPAITASLTILTAFVFSRWFLSSTSQAVVATAVFLLVMLAWGETHFAYGNRVFVRLFQGKGLIIALTTPFAILTGLVLSNRPSYYVAGVLALTNISAIGVSSSGLIMTIFTSVVVFTIAINKDFNRMIRAWILIAAAMIYPVLAATWIKFQNNSLILMSDIGTHMPINASLGLDLRESMLMVALLLGFLLFISNRNKSYVLIIVAIFAFILNPWVSEVISNVTSRNMSWRLAWAAPVPLLFSIALVTGLNLRVQTNSLAVNKGIVFYGAKLAVASIIIVFFFSYKWAISSVNNVSWGFPAHKLPNEFYIASQISKKIRSLDTTGQILAHDHIAAWLPLTLPSVKLLMPGHTYPTQLETILPKHDFESRMLLYNAINNGITDKEVFFKSIREFDINLVVMPISSEYDMRGLSFKSNDLNVSLEKIETFQGFCLYKVVWRE